MWSLWFEAIENLPTSLWWETIFNTRLPSASERLAMAPFSIDRLGLPSEKDIGRI